MIINQIPLTNNLQINHIRDFFQVDSPLKY